MAVKGVILQYIIKKKHIRELKISGGVGGGGQRRMVLGGCTCKALVMNLGGW